MNRHPDMPEVAALLAAHMTTLAPELADDKPTSRTGTTWRFRSKGSLAVMVAGTDRGSWYDHEAGRGGDALALVAHLRGMPMADAWRWALAWLGLGDGEQVPAPSQPAVAPPKRLREVSPPATLEPARRIWREAVAPAGTLVQAYLASRGLALEPGAPIRFHANCPRGWDKEQHRPTECLPAMVALMTDPVTGEPCGVHRTFLARDGSGKAADSAAGTARMMLGANGVIRLVPDEDVTLGLGLAEGIETSLAVMQGYGWRPVWAATSAGTIARFPALAGIGALTLFADADKAGMDAAEACATTWRAAGAEVRIIAPPAGQDFNDLARERAAA